MNENDVRRTYRRALLELAAGYDKAGGSVEDLAALPDERFIEHAACMARYRTGATCPTKKKSVAAEVTDFMSDLLYVPSSGRTSGGVASDIVRYFADAEQEDDE